MSFLDLYEGDQAQAAKMQPGEGTRLPSGFTENFDAAWGDGKLFSQSIARANSRNAALSDYVDEIRQKTGQDLSKVFIPDIAGGGQTGVSDFTQANERVTALKQDHPDLDIAPLDDAEIDRRALAKAQAAHRTYEELQSGEKGPGGSIGSFLGSAGAAATDPINIVGLGVAPEAGGVSILSAALRWGAIAGVSQAAIEASSDQFKEHVQPGYMESGQPLQEIAGAAVGGAVLGGATKALGNAWTKVKTGSWPTSVRDAGNVIESEAHTAQTNPFPGVEGEVAHREALVKTIDDILAGRPVQIDHIITPDFLERSRALTDRLQAEQPMSLPVINRRALDLTVEQDKLATRDTELAATLEKLPPGDASAADRLNRLQAVEQQIAETTDPAAKRALNERRDQILVDTNPEALQAAAAPIEQRRVADAERGQIAARLQDISDEHARMQAEQSLLGPMRLPALGQRERVPGPKGQQLELPLEQPKETGITAYHGSPHDFESFDASKLHTGEGSDTRGRGMYFTEQPKAAEFYRDFKGKGTLYQVQIKGTEDKFIDWDKPANEQSPFVKRYLEKLGIDGDLSGHELQEEIANKVISAEIEKRGGDYSGITPDIARSLPTQDMMDAGIIGNKYGSEAGNRNYVVFNDKNVTITHKNDVLVGAQPPLQTAEEMAKTLTAPDHQEAIRADIDRAIADRATGSQNTPRATFTTAKGSTYSAFEDGTTIRNKAARPDVGHEGDSGIKPRTAKTIYVDGDASVLSGAGLQGDVGGKGYRVAIKDGKATFLWWNEKEGKWGAPPSGRDIPFSTKPEVGKSPVELWKPATDVPGYEAYRGQHAGNKITSVTEHPKPPTEIMVPGIDENGNHTMVGVDKAMDEVDAYKAAAEQIQACANPIQEAAE